MPRSHPPEIPPRGVYSISQNTPPPYFFRDRKAYTVRNESKADTPATDSAKPTEADALVYVVEGMSCGHCEIAVTDEVARVPGVDAVAVDLHSKRVTVRGQRLNDEALRGAIEDAGYEAAPA